jgi:hypothetical protein
MQLDNYQGEDPMPRPSGRQSSLHAEGAGVGDQNFTIQFSELQFRFFGGSKCYHPVLLGASVQIQLYSFFISRVNQDHLKTSSLR